MPKKTVQISKKLMGKKLDGEWVFLNLDNGEYYGLNETGSLVWDKLSEGRSVEEILDRLEETYRVDRTVLEKDVRNLLKELSRGGLLRVEELAA